MSSLTSNYEIIREIGRGGMGAVFLANDKRLMRQVAIKVLKLPPDMDLITREETINNFKREAVAIANLSHANIVCIYDIGQQSDINYFVMELIDGAPLSKILSRQQSPFNLETVLKIADEACDALSYIHYNKVIHRDIKPENFIYTTKNVTKLTDFGISKFTGDEGLKIKQEPGTVKGTILYISPEQLHNPDDIDERADMYSLSVSLYEMLTGVLPFEGETPREVIMKILTDSPVPPSKVNNELLPHIDQVILKAMARDPDKRYSDIEELKNELKNISEYRSRFAIQPRQNLSKTDKVYYSRICIENFEDIGKNAEIFPVEAQQRLLYEIEMLFSKYYEEYRNVIEEDPKQTSENRQSEIKAPPPPNSNVSGFIESFNYIIPKVAPNGAQALKSLSVPMELILFLSKVNGVNTFMEIINNHYSIDKVSNLFNLLYSSVQKELLVINVVAKPPKQVLLGDMLVKLGVITQFQLDYSFNIKKQNESKGIKGKLIGEILLDTGYITRDKLLHVLKLQHWYRRLFS